MNSPQVKFNINRFFPFYILIDSGLKVNSIGKSLAKIYPVQINSSFTSVFHIQRPRVSITHSTDLHNLENQLIVLETKSDKPITFRGQFNFLEEEQSFLFVGTPWLSSMDKVRDINLTMLDFAVHDPMIDLLHVLKTQEIATDEIKQLLKKVSEQKNKLIESEANYRSIVENSTDIIYKTDQYGQFTFVNSVAERITGYTKDELLGLRYTSMVREDYVEKAIELYTQQVLTKTPTTYFEFPIRTKQGKEIWIGQSVQYPQSENSAVELTALAIDVTDKKQAENNLVLQEEKYRNIIANMNLGLLEVDLHEVIQYANQSFATISGYTREELIGQKATDLFLDEKDREILALKNTLRMSGVSDVYSISIRNKKKEIRWWVISGAPRYNDNGDLVGSVGIHLDVTEQKHLEEELKIAKLKAEESSKAKESFLATMSHELRTPLNAIVGISNIMQINPKAINQENFRILNFSAKNLLALIADILDFSKIEAGKIELTRSPFDLRAVVTGIIETFRPECEGKDIQLQSQLDESIPFMLLGDELRLSQILNNLISNAIKFTAKGHVHINVGICDLTTEKVCLEFKISDTGIGISKDKLEHIFDAFEQADATIVRKYGGTGLGLNITRKLIELQGGHIHAESKLDKGSQFYFKIDYPFLQNTNSKSDNTKMGPTQGQVSIKDKLVLLVEDNIVNQQVAISYLSYWGLKYDIANNGKEALDKLAVNSYALILIDLFMPVMDGFEAIRRIKRKPLLKNIPIIALTASAEQNLIDKALALGANKCLPKPFNADQLHQAMIDLITLAKPVVTQKPVKRALATKASKKRLIDLKRIEDASLGSKAFVKDMLTTLGNEIPGLMDEGDALLEKGDFQQFSKLIHKLKNNLLLLGMDFLRSDLNFMEEKAKESPADVKIKPLFENTKATWQKARIELEAFAISLG